mmetsp:Transcript_89183/g.154554  ORF Transcript_89183/g.154554 Transcript_89183/m.154554 type:complete len:225 (-) Transcript_89183:1618-2292(-)
MDFEHAFVLGTFVVTGDGDVTARPGAVSVTGWLLRKGVRGARDGNNGQGTRGRHNASRVSINAHRAARQLHIGRFRARGSGAAKNTRSGSGIRTREGTGHFIRHYQSLPCQRHLAAGLWGWGLRYVMVRKLDANLHRACTSCCCLTPPQLFLCLPGQCHRLHPDLLAQCGLTFLHLDEGLQLLVVFLVGVHALLLLHPVLGQHLLICTFLVLVGRKDLTSLPLQ